MKNKHHDKENSRTGTVLCTEINSDERHEEIILSILCIKNNYRFINMDGLIEHLVETHNQSINVTTKRFTNLHSYMPWKEELKIKSSSLFVLHSSPKQQVDCICYSIIAIELANIIQKGKVKEISRHQRLDVIVLLI